MKQCKFDEFLLQEYLDGTIDVLEKIILEEHLKSCAYCRRELTELKLLMWEFESLPDIELPSEIPLLRSKTLNQLQDAHGTNSFGIKELVDLQRNVLQNAGSFLEMAPGVKPGMVALKKGVKKAPSVLYRTVDVMLKGRKRLLALRDRL
ncbi:hypothetical protein HNQ80_005019 [Anaerosolibacter carboniphilus]|uniref:Anti-sigma-W factor RsiW n=1 Tax=Anaerosolibacter carboniphilus TaxID=1417629 RepID=A0A841KYY7_9FIRM|nr:zf-HC2 domain-containing protein [Anaerosolibacter carboniphilus]MBB6218844.1 hypothetical protein [Anaerosolibacter carboniphilus]